MKVLLITSHSPFEEVTGPLAAGAEIAMRRIAEKLALRGHEVHYLTFGADTEGFLQLKHVNIHFFPVEFAQEKLGGSAEQLLRALLRRLRDKAFSAKRFPPAKRLAASLDRFLRRLDYYSWNFKRIVGDIIDKYDIDVVHSFSSMPDSLAAATVCHKKGVPLAIRMGGRYWYLKYHRLPVGQTRLTYQSEMNYVFHKTACLAYNSNFLHKETSEMFRSLGIDASPAGTIIDIGVSLPEAVADLPNPLGDYDLDDCFIISCIGKFKDDSKRQDLLVEALQHVKLKDRRRVRVVFAGSGPTENRIKELVSKHGYESNCIFLGSIAHGAVFRLMQLSDVICHPTEFEGSSKAVAEAMLCGKVVIGSRIPPIAEHIVDGQNGFLARNTPRHFGQKIRFVLENPTELERVAQNATEYAKEHFDPERNILKYEELFGSLVADSRRKAA